MRGAILRKRLYVKPSRKHWLTICLAIALAGGCLLVVRMGFEHDHETTPMLGERNSQRSIAQPLTPVPHKPLSNLSSLDAPVDYSTWIRHYEESDELMRLLQSSLSLSAQGDVGANTAALLVLTECINTVASIPFPDSPARIVDDHQSLLATADPLVRATRRCRDFYGSRREWTAQRRAVIQEGVRAGAHLAMLMDVAESTADRDGGGARTFQLNALVAKGDPVALMYASQHLRDSTEDAREVEFGFLLAACELGYACGPSTFLRQRLCSTNRDCANARSATDALGKLLTVDQMIGAVSDANAVLRAIERRELEYFSKTLVWH